MARKDYVCPIMKKTCIGCSVYRGRHMGLWIDEKPAKQVPQASKKAASTRRKSSSENGSDWVTSFDAFVRSVEGPECIAFDWDKQK